MWNQSISLKPVVGGTMATLRFETLHSSYEENIPVDAIGML